LDEGQVQRGNGDGGPTTPRPPVQRGNGDGGPTTPRPPVQRGNGDGGPTTPRPPVKPKPTGGHLVREGQLWGGYQPRAYWAVYRVGPVG
jgi:hypothetical protein